MAVTSLESNSELLGAAKAPDVAVADLMQPMARLDDALELLLLAEDAIAWRVEADEDTPLADRASDLNDEQRRAELRQLRAAVQLIDDRLAELDLVVRGSVACRRAVITAGLK